METFDQEFLKTVLDNYINSWMTVAKEGTRIVVDTLKKIEELNIEQIEYNEHK